MIEFLRQVLGIAFYILFFIWLFLKLRNIYSVHKMNCKETYKEIKKNIKNNKKPKLFNYAKIFLLIILALIVVYIAGLILSLMVELIIFIFTGFGIALYEVEGLTWLKCIFAFFYLYLSSFKYGIYVITFAVYVIYFILLSMGIYIENVRYKELKNVNERDDNLSSTS